MNAARLQQQRQFTVNHGYSHFIRFFRKFMVFGALLLILAVGLWLGFYKGNNTVEPVKTAEVSSEAALIKASFDGIDKKGQPFRVTSDKTVQELNNQDIYDLTRPMADIVSGQGRWMAASAQQGLFNNATSVLFLEENVKLFYDDGMEFSLENAELDLMENTAVSRAPVQGQGPAGTISAQGMEISGDGNRITFEGPARMRLRTAGEK